MQTGMADIYCGWNISCKASKEQTFDEQVGRRKTAMSVVHQSSSLG